MIKGTEKIDKWVLTIHGKQPLCKCGSFLTLIGEEPYEWICIKCEPEKLRGKGNE